MTTERICTNCGKPELSHSHVGDSCPEGDWFSKTKSFSDCAMTIAELKTASTAAYEAHMASGLIVETHRDLLAQAISQQQETRRVWLELSKQLHEAEVAQ